MMMSETQWAEQVSMMANQIRELRQENQKLKELFINQGGCIKSAMKLINDKQVIIRELKNLKALLNLAMGTIEFYADGEIGNDLEIRPEKKELWSTPEKWSQRSMSDHYVGKRARATREDINKQLKELK